MATNNSNSSNSRKLNEIKHSIRQGIGKITLEGLVYGETPDGGQDEERPMGSQMHDAEEPGMERRTGMGKAPDGAEPNAFDEDPEISKLLINIRIQTLKGLEKLAAKPDTAQYEMLKKIFLLIDKSVEEKEGDNE